MQFGTYVYLVKATGAITPSKFNHPEEKEYTVPGGIDAEDMILNSLF